MAGVPLTSDWGYFESQTASIPEPLLDALTEKAGLPGVLGNCKASGTDILMQLGEEHLRTGRPIVYTSADSVLQIAAHEEHFGLERLLAVCRIARKLVDPYRIARVIARPFTGKDAASFVRTSNRRDFSMPPPVPTLLDHVCRAGGTVVAVGKVADIFASQGVTHVLHTSGQDQLLDVTLQAWEKAEDRSLVLTNFVDFDTVYGHRRDVAGYARALEAFDLRLPELLGRMREGDLCVLTADHGCDPTWAGTDHTRERVPILAFGPSIRPGSMGVRDSLADIGATVARFLGVKETGYGQPFLE